MPDGGRILNPLFCTFLPPSNGPVEALRRPDPETDDDDWEALDPSADDLETDPDDVDWWLEDDDEDDDAPPDDPTWPATDDEDD